MLYEVITGDAYRIQDKLERQGRVGEVKEATVEKLAGGETPAFGAEAVLGALESLEKRVITSYSIHYTKLYDRGGSPPQGRRGRGPPQGRRGRGSPQG